MQQLPLKTKAGAEIEIVTLYQLGSTDGYHDRYNGPYYRTSADANVDKTSGYVIGPKTVKAVELDFGRFLILESATPITIKGETTYDDELRAQTLSRLTPAQREAIEAVKNLYSAEERRLMGL